MGALKRLCRLRWSTSSDCDFGMIYMMDMIGVEVVVAFVEKII